MKDKTDFQKGIDYLFNGDAAWFERIVLAAAKRAKRAKRIQGRS